MIMMMMMMMMMTETTTMKVIEAMIQVMMMMTVSWPRTYTGSPKLLVSPRKTAFEREAQKSGECALHLLLAVDADAPHLVRHSRV